jgi:hypothetical protein
MGKNAKTWQDVENLVRDIATHLYNRKAEAKTISGIKCDAVIELAPDNIVVIEVSKEHTLEKLRIDLAKLDIIKHSYFQQGIYVKCYFICDVKLHPSIKESAASFHVEALSIHEFSQKLFNFDDYHYIRKTKTFGSAVDPITGESDPYEYTPVTYWQQDVGEIKLDKLSDMLIDGKYIILTGEYGTGKSRCIKELFERISISTQKFYKFPISINLKENWGLKRAAEILSRHFLDLGLSDKLDSLMKIYDKTSICYLLDGFDEVGAQTWSDSPEKLKEIRRKSLEGVKELILNSKGGCIISGREHYFKNNNEMIECLGLDKKNAIFVTCKNEFSTNEVKEYLKNKANIEFLPEWLPKKPLLCQIIKDIEVSDIKKLFNSEIAEYDFFDSFLELICERESRINISLSKDVIMKVLISLSLLVRVKPTPYGPITINEINKTFEEITGNTVADESAIMLQRLPGLGRIDSNNHDRQFIDDYILSGLQSISTLKIITENIEQYFSQFWKNNISPWGLKYMSNKLTNSQLKGMSVFLLKKFKSSNNKILLGDIISSLSIADDGCIDFNNVEIKDAEILILDLTHEPFENLTIDSAYIKSLIIENYKSTKVIIKNSCIASVEGITSSEACPSWLSNHNLIESYQEVGTLSQIKKSKLNECQQIFLILTRKLFMQPGAGRKEASLYKGYNNAEQKKKIEKILQLLLKEDICDIILGDEGYIYKPNRKHTEKIINIHRELTLSSDTLWTKITNMNK